jgi:hypothetical protein
MRGAATRMARALRCAACEVIVCSAPTRADHAQPRERENPSRANDRAGATTCRSRVGGACRRCLRDVAEGARADRRAGPARQRRRTVGQKSFDSRNGFGTIFK